MGDDSPEEGVVGTWVLGVGWVGLVVGEESGVELAGVGSNCFASSGPIVEKKVLMKVAVSFRGTGVPSSLFSCMIGLGVDLFINELTSCQNFRGLSFKFANLSWIKAARAFLITLLVSVRNSRALGRR